MVVDKIIDTLKSMVVLYGYQVLAAFAILVIGRVVSGILRSLIVKLLKRSRVDETLISFISSVSYVALMAFVVISALEKLGMQTTSFVAIIGAAGLAIGLALQGSLSNFASGVLMIIFKPFKVGDFIDGAGTSGIVEEIGIFTTELKSPDNKKIIIPNSKLTSDNIINFSAKPERRIDIVAGVSYGDNLEKVKTILKDILDSHPKVLKEPAYTIGVLELADSSVNFAVRPWVKKEDYWDVYFNLQETIKNRFDESGVTIPFPQQDVHMHKAE